MRALLLAVFSFLLFASPVSAQVAQQCALDKTVTDGNQTFNQCPQGSTLNFLITQGYSGARLDPDVDLSATPMYLYSDGQCRYVDARGTADSLFIPFGSNAEWTAFLANAPTGVHTANCCLPRPLTVGDVPPITAVPNVAACSTGWKFDGLADPSNYNNLLATPAGTTANSGFTLAAGVGENPNYPITGLPIERDDIQAQLPTGASAGQPYVARYRCVTTSGNTTNTQIQLIQFALQCTSSNWSYTGSGCVSGTIALFNEPCPNGGSGSITKQVVRQCPSGESTVTVLSNTCTAACVPGQIAGTTTTAQCPAGQTGLITRAQFRQCPSGTVTTQDVSNTCTATNPTCTGPANICPTGSTATCTTVNGQCSCTCSGNCPTGQTDLGITTTQCPSGQNGVIQTHTFRSCTSTNNQCVCGLAATEEDNCSTSATCTPTTPATCPAGQASVCTPSGPGGQCNCLCAPATCAPRTVTTETQQCPAGQTGSKTIQHVKLCSSTQSGGAAPDGNGCFCTTTDTVTSNTCVATPTCVPSTDLGNSNQSCPNGQVGTVVVNTKKICVVQNNQCVCHNEVTEVTRACEPVQTCVPSTDLGNSTQNCPSGQTGQIVVNTKKICSLSVGCSLGNCPPAQCTCNNVQTTVSNTCTPVVCTPSTDLGDQTLACPAGQTGMGIKVHTVRECTASNNQCVCVSRYRVISEECDGASQCPPTTDLGNVTRACPSGQSGSIVVKRVKTCTPCAGSACQCSTQEIPVSNTCTASCVPSSRTETEQCPAGSTGSIVKTISHLCDCAGGRDVVTSVQNTCTTTTQCVPTSTTENIDCPAGYTGSHTRTTQHVCDCPGGRDIVTESNTCKGVDVPVCTPDTLIGTGHQSCGGWDWNRGGYGQITVEHHRVCASIGNQCVCRNEDRITGTCSTGGHGNRHDNRHDRHDRRGGWGRYDDSGY